MMRLKNPVHEFDKTIDECCSGITGNKILFDKLSKNKGYLINQGLSYLEFAAKGELYLIPHIDSSNDDNPKVISELRRADLVKIYDQYFVAGAKPARKIYESILSAAKEQCPFCGGIGVPRNLDHFLPKTHFPQFSLFPRNLVPACRDCNMDGKGQKFSKNAEDQIIQPYLDNDRFFVEQWIFCRYHLGNGAVPGDFEYFADAPTNWPEVDKKRAEKHFSDFDLGKRYGIKAAERLGLVLRQVQTLKDKNLDAEIKSIIFQPPIDAAPFPNHWTVGMHQALMKDLI
ncbi:HNH endonuclease [Janthinobacterium sp. NKUCC06_STL]|uniref:HNH endonuclease n=1 Tax=Janthinobacterium sp. NKUCC06_STL TaxID=2842127 RepID=UPI001C5AA5C8|nr:HNH endonuclease signature motif containing protein [Janthinobacterium sp. NKUCC06_STL]MBW3509474.1 HNH endonuclease [Janthinobacterium sp. NKUCC06_STL]